jgi:hypothetical protein
MALLSQSARF